MVNDTQIALQLGPINQIGFVVKDLNSSIKLYEPMFGEFRTLDAFDQEWDYRGRQEISSIKLAFAQYNDLEVELIEWVSGETPHKEFIDAGREGMHHLRFIVENLEQKMQEAEAFGYRSVWYKRFGKGLAAAYLERDGDPLFMEFFENHQGL